MPIDRRAAAEPSAAVARVVAVAALSFESGALRKPLRSPAVELVVAQSGPGAAKAAAAARAAVADGATALVSWGVAGGLDAALAPGTVLAPAGVLHGDRWLDADAAWRAALVAALEPRFAVHEGALLATDAVLRSPEEKSLAAARCGAVAADMESGGVAAVAAEAGLPFVALRVVLDALADELPADAERWIDQQGNRRLTPALDAALRPARWAGLFALARRYRTAAGVLDRLARVLLPVGFLFSPRVAKLG
ncbi:MAG TPA: purine phosphorylase [Gammaproteobacteria bacterium]